MSSAEQGVPFDFEGNGRPQRFAWPIRPDDAWLVLDRNNNGTVDNGGELFGNATLLSSGSRAAHGFEVLSEMDENQDGLVSEDDPFYRRLMLWRDSIRNGVTDPGELVPLRQAGLMALATEYDTSERIDEHGNEFRYRSFARFRNAPFRRPVWDVFLRSVSLGGPTQ